MVNLQFTLQQKNYQDLPKFLKLCQDRKYLPNITNLDDWRTWSSPNQQLPATDPFTIKYGTFLENDVLNPQHPEHQECINILKYCKTTYPSTYMYSVKVNNLL